MVSDERTQGAAEIVYPGPGHSASSQMTSLGAVRGPQAAAGAVDHLSEETSRAQRPRLSPSQTGPHSEPFGMLDLEDLPETYGVDEVEIMYKDPWWTFVYWEVTEGGVQAARAQLGPSGEAARLVLRLFTTQQSGGESVRELRDVPLSWNHGRRYVDVPRPGALLRVAVGLLSAEGYFAPIAHSSHLQLPPPHPGGPGGPPAEWMHVQPLRGRGEQRERLTVLGRALAHLERRLAWRVAAGYEPVRDPAAGPGDDELLVRLPEAAPTSPRSGGLR